MAEERTEFTARTSAGALIAIFADRAQAISWAESHGECFPGWVIQAETTITIIRTRTVRRDRSLERT